MLEIDPAFREKLAASTGAAQVVVRSADVDAAVRGLRRARTALFQIPHPEEPEDPLPSYASAVAADETSARFRFDIADAEAYTGLIDQVADAIIAALEAEGVDGHLAAIT